MNVYKNPLARKWLYYYGLFSLLTLIIIGYVIHTTNTYVQQEVTQQFNNVIASYINGDNILSFLSTHQLSPGASEQINFVSTLKLAPVDSTVSHYYIAGFLIWLSISLIGFIGLTIFIHYLFKQLRLIEQVSNHHTYHPLDISLYSEDIFSRILDNNIKSTIALKTQTASSTMQRQLLAKHMSDMSHQLKTPLTSAYVILDSLYLQNAINDTQFNQLDRSLSRIDHITQSLLLMTQLDSRRITYQRSVINGKQFLSNLLDPLLPIASHKNITIQRQFESNIDIYADQFFLTEALSNIVKNALDHAHSTIKITLTQNPFYAIVTIYNDGEQISQDDLPHLFERFYRGKNALASSLGIGLSLAYEIIENHNGKLKVENTDSGVLFTASIEKSTKN